VPRRAALRRAETGELRACISEQRDDGGDAVTSCVRAPGADNAAVRADRIEMQPQRGRVRRAQRIQVRDRDAARPRAFANDA
jgi:hypothetical protein